MAETYTLKWDQPGEKKFETGVDHCVLYDGVSEDADYAYASGVAWNGITGITESPSGAEDTDFYADNIKYGSMKSKEDFGATITAYTYPDEWEKHDGSLEPTPGVKIGQQSRTPFGLSYRTKIGDDLNGDNAGYKLHLIYGGSANPSERGYQTVNDSPEAIEFSWEITTTPVNVNGYNATSSLTIDSTKFTGDKAAKLEELEKILYGDGTTTPKLPTPDKVIALLGSAG